MSDVDNSHVPPMVRQAQLSDEIASQIPHDVEGDWQRITYVRRAVSMYAQEVLHVHRPNGRVEAGLAPLAIEDLVDELRTVMYQRGSGTWFSATWEIVMGIDGGVSSDVIFNYDDEPDWSRQIPAVNYAIDLEDYPRDPENIPSWLQRRLEEAEKDVN